MVSNTVVQKRKPISEAEFHAALMVDWSRMIKKVGLAQFALDARLSERQVRNIQAGSIPHALTIFNLQTEDDLAIESVEAEYGRRTVPKDAVCSSDQATLPLAALLHHVAAAEHPDSHGGEELTKYEADHIPDEDVAAAQRVLDHITALKRAPNVRSVG